MSHQRIQCGICRAVMTTCRCIESAHNVSYDICDRCLLATEVRFKVYKTDGSYFWDIVSGGVPEWTSKPYSSADEAMRALEWTVDIMDVNSMRNWLLQQYDSAPKWTQKVRAMSDQQVVAVYFRMNSRKDTVK